MKKQYFVDIDNEFDDIDSDLKDMIKSLTFRNRSGRKAFRFNDDEMPPKRKRNHHRPRTPDYEVF